MTKSGGETRLVLGMLALGLLGAVLGVVRAVVLEGPEWWRLLIAVPPLLTPLGVVGTLVVWGGRQPGQRRAATWGGWAAALAAAGTAVLLLDPGYNRDANIGLGVYVILGWLIPLGPAVVLGSLIGVAWTQLRRPAATGTAAHTHPVAGADPAARAGSPGPWLWGLLLPALVTLAGELGQAITLPASFPDDRVTAWLSLLVAVPVMLTNLAPLLLPLLLLRARVAHSGRRRERLWGYWGLCLGWGTGSLLLSWPGLRPELSVLALYSLTALLTVFGYLGGRQLARLL